MVARRCDGRAVIAVRHENDVARADFLEHFDRSLGGSVHAVVAETFGPGGASVDLEVVDLFQADSTSLFSSCLWLGYDDQFPPGVMTSHAMMESASKVSAVAKL